MEVKPGYKQTEVGVIPQEWEVDAMGDIFEISGGLSASREQLSAKGYCYLHYGDIHKSTKSFIDIRAEFLDIPKLDIPLSRVPSKSLLADGDVVFVDASEDDEGTSKHFVIVNPEGIPYISGLHTIVAKSKTSLLDNAYKRYCFQTHDLRRQFYFYAVGTKVSGISKSNIKKVFIPCPPIPEQHAIAEVLSDVDALLGGLDRIIAKKRDLKQAAMQQLLTGRERLPGFHVEWEVKTLDQVGRCFAGGTPSTAQQDYWGGDIYWLQSGRIQNNILASPGDSEVTITRRGLDESAAKRIRPKSVLVAITGATCANVGLLQFEAAANQSVVAIRFIFLLDRYLPLWRLHRDELNSAPLAHENWRSNERSASAGR